MDLDGNRLQNSCTPRHALGALDQVLSVPGNITAMCMCVYV